ncbi:hypothetical protein [Methanobacterium formicicum]|uniref:hypothetical protein n=1 Tax=Methanobacterium formicicum TaxID=2162 RepID=UPI0024125082|nr:hypothetical protein [Methanobacterium formicicum]MDG3546608.1 hypothetical protein [Methanobacterium formicicum]
MWRAQIEGDPESLEILRKNFRNHIIVEDNKYYLQYPQFGPDKEDLLQYAEDVFNNMISLLSFDLNKKWNVTLQSSFENIRKDGRDIIAFAEPISIKLNVYATVNGEVSDLDIVKKDLEKYLECIERNEMLKNALYFYNKQDWVNLNKVLELIVEDMGESDIVNRNWVTNNEIDLFRCTAHNIEGAGRDARHAVSKIRPKCERILESQDPMKLPAANKFIKRLLMNWIDFNCEYGQKI